MGCQLGLEPGALRGLGVLGWPGPLFYPQGPLFCSIHCHRLCSYCRQDVLLFWLWGLWAGEVPAVLWQGYGASQTMKPRDQLYAEYPMGTLTCPQP